MYYLKRIQIWDKRKFISRYKSVVRASFTFFVVPPPSSLSLSSSIVPYLSLVLVLFHRSLIWFLCVREVHVFVGLVFFPSSPGLFVCLPFVCGCVVTAVMYVWFKHARLNVYFWLLRFLVRIPFATLKLTVHSTPVYKFYIVSSHFPFLDFWFERNERNCKHTFIDLLFLFLLAYICARRRAHTELTKITKYAEAFASSIALACFAAQLEVSVSVLNLRHFVHLFLSAVCV